MADDSQVFFVKPPTDQENNSVLTKAFFQAVKNLKNKHQWLSQEDCLKLGKEKGVYICEPFSGPAFEHLQSVENQIYGPQCILSCLLHEMELPKRFEKPRAIYNLAMRNVILCCTSIDKAVREDIQAKVLLMSGEVVGGLSKKTTHLIAGEVGTNKYNVAYDHGIKVMTADWVLKVWEASLKPGHILAQDEQFEKYRCPPFLGLTVVVSGYHSAERNTLKNFVLRGGGNYSEEMKKNECTHLITKKPEGANYEAAKTWKIKIVEDKWLKECMDKKRYVDPTPFLIEKK